MIVLSNRQWLWRVILIVVLAVQGTVTIQAQEDDIPYIHYYDFLQQGLVIERADGTDNRIILDLLPEDHNNVVWLGWSPSGQWFALGSYHFNGQPADYGVTVQVVRADGQEHYELETYHQSTLETSWHPYADHLLVFGQYLDEVLMIHTQILDVTTGRNLVKAEFRRGYSNSDWISANVYWSADGRCGYIYWHGVDEKQLVTLCADGQIEIWDMIPGYIWEDHQDFTQGRMLYTKDSHPTPLVIIENTEQRRIGRRIEIEETDGLAAHYGISWSSNFEYALLYRRPCPDESCEGWLKLVNWPTGEVKTLSPTLFIWEFCGHLASKCPASWSPQGNYVILIERNGRYNNLHLLDVQSGAIRLLAADVPYGQFEYDVFFWTIDEKLIFDDQRDPQPRSLYLYDPVTDQFELIIEQNDNLSYGINFTPSPSGQYIGLNTNGATIIDQEGAVIVQSPASLLRRGRQRGYIWHDSEEWVLVNYSHPGGGRIASVLLNLAGSVQRELPMGAAAGFVPETVIWVLTQ